MAPQPNLMMPLASRLYQWPAAPLFSLLSQGKGDNLSQGWAVPGSHEMSVAFLFFFFFFFYSFVPLVYHLLAVIGFGAKKHVCHQCADQLLDSDVTSAPVRKTRESKKKSAEARFFVQQHPLLACHVCPGFADT